MRIHIIDLEEQSDQKTGSSTNHTHSHGEIAAREEAQGGEEGGSTVCTNLPRHPALGIGCRTLVGAVGSAVSKDGYSPWKNGARAVGSCSTLQSTSLLFSTVSSTLPQHPKEQSAPWRVVRPQRNCSGVPFYMT